MKKLKVNDTFRRNGNLFTIKNIRQESYKNGIPCIMVECTMNDCKVIDSYFVFKLTTKVK